MIKKVLSFVLVIAVIFTLGACKGKGDKLGCKVGVITGPRELFPEAADAVDALAAQYGDEIVSAGFSADYANDGGKAIESIAKALINESNVKAIVFAQSVTGTANALDKIKELAPDIPVICCYTDENADTLAKASAVINPDMAAMGKLAVEQAKKAGATNFYYYSFQRNEGYENNIALKSAVEENCKQNGLEFYQVNSVDPLSANGASGAGRFIIEDAARNQYKKKEGQIDAYLSTDPAVFASLVKSAVMYKNAIVPQGHGSLYSGLKDGLEIDMTGNEGNMSYILEKAKEKLSDISGKAFAPAVSLPTLIIGTAVICAAKVASNPKTTLDAIDVSKAADKSDASANVEVNMPKDGVFTFSTSAIKF